MASPNEPNNESVRIDLPLPTAEKSPAPNIKPRETARIPLVPDPLPSAGQMKNTQSVIMPNVAPRNPSSASAPAEKKPMLLYWILLGVSALILIIQIWTYFS